MLLIADVHHDFSRVRQWIVRAVLLALAYVEKVTQKRVFGLKLTIISVEQTPLLNHLKLFFARCLA